MIEGKKTIRDFLTPDMKDELTGIWSIAQKNVHPQQKGDSDQSRAHCVKVEQHLNRLIPDQLKEFWKKDELFILSAAACLHDVGKIIDDKASISGYSHGKRSAEIIVNDYEKFGLQYGHALAIAAVVERHDDVFEDKGFREYRTSNDGLVDIRKLSAVFKLADDLHSDAERSPSLSSSIQGKQTGKPISFKAIGRQAITGWDIKGNEIIFSIAPQDKQQLYIAKESIRRLTENLSEDMSSILEYHGIPYKYGVPDINDQYMKKDENDALPTKAVVFDFDGTLTLKSGRRSTWELIWVELGYPVSECAKYYDKYKDKKITHQGWCDITCDKFRGKGLSDNILKDIANRITLVPDTEEAIRLLVSKGIKVYIVSGSISRIIKHVLGDSLFSLFADVKANEMVLDTNGLLQEIKGTKYDFQGKAQFLTEVIKQNGWEPWEVLFIGNSDNDLEAYKAGVRTLCVNPHLTTGDKRQNWENTIHDIDSLLQIMKYIK